ncbi:TY-Chap domain-containing protein [Zeimonas arvi]|uniref:TY-Chap domain-containing protein n=1 Tax=Zeimonas arvi TaxID=2498847 RepID=UPI003899D680
MRERQVAGQDHAAALGMLAEAVSNHYLPRGERLDDAAHCRLLQLGWWAPTHEPEESGPRAWGGSPNYFLMMEAPVDSGMLAEIAIGALVSVYGAKAPRQLEYRAFSRCGAGIELPVLGLAPAER